LNFPHNYVSNFVCLLIGVDMLLYIWLCYQGQMQGIGMYPTHHFSVSICHVSCSVSHWTRHLFNNLFSKTSRVRWHHEGRTIRDFSKARNDAVAVVSTGPYGDQFNLLHTD